MLLMMIHMSTTTYKFTEDLFLVKAEELIISSLINSVGNNFKKDMIIVNYNRLYRITHILLSKVFYFTEFNMCTIIKTFILL